MKWIESKEMEIVNVGKIFWEVYPTEELWGRRRCLICLCGRRLACVVTQMLLLTFQGGISEVPDYPSTPFQGVLFAFILETLCFSLKRYFSRTLETQMLVIMPLVCFLSGKPSILKASSTPSDPDVIFSVNWWTKTRLSACWKCNTQLGQGICIYVSFLGVVFAAIIFS